MAADYTITTKEEDIPPWETVKSYIQLLEAKIRTLEGRQNATPVAEIQ